VSVEEDADPYIFFTEKRGIPEHIWKARPYLWWTPDNSEPATAPFADLTSGQRAFVARIARQSPGWVITRYPPALWPPLPKVYPELRPIVPVKIGLRPPHWHGDGPELEGLKPWERLLGKPGSKLWRKHINRDKDHHPAIEPDDGGINDHRGVNTETIHRHRHWAKYVFPSSPSVVEEYDHDHADGWKRRSAADRPLYRERHVAGQPGGVDVAGPHWHTRRVKDGTVSLARRIDVHPLAEDRIRSADVVFFVIEGCIKADAVLADDGAVLSVPSVSLWDCDELRRFTAQYLVGKVVVVVPDADWYTKDQVINQARLCQNSLISYGVQQVHVAAPPSTLGGRSTKGVDDFIGAGGHLEDLQVIDYEVPPALYEMVAREWSWRRDRRRRDAETLAGLANFTGERGSLHAPLSTVARVLNMSPRAVSEAVRDLEAMGAVTIEGGDLATGGSWFSAQLDWQERPAIVLAPGLRATERAAVRLADLVQVRREGVAA